MQIVHVKIYLDAQPEVVDQAVHVIDHTKLTARRVRVVNSRNISQEANLIGLVFFQELNQ